MKSQFWDCCIHDGASLICWNTPQLSVAMQLPQRHPRWSSTPTPTLHRGPQNNISHFPSEVILKLHRHVSICGATNELICSQGGEASEIRTCNWCSVAGITRCLECSGVLCDIHKLNTNRQKRSAFVVTHRFEASCVFLAFLFSLFFLFPIKLLLYEYELSHHMKENEFHLKRKKKEIP